MDLVDMAHMITEVVERGLPHDKTSKGIIFPLRIEVGGGGGALCRYLNLFFHRSGGKTLVGAHRPTTVPLPRKGNLLNDWELLTHHEVLWREEGVLRFLIESYLHLSKEYDPEAPPKSVHLDLRFARAPFTVDLTQANRSPCGSRINLEFQLAA